MRLSSVHVAGLLILGALSAPATAQHQSAGPSFDCNTARPGAEQAICVYPDLAQLDRTMAELYEQVRAARTGAAREALIAEQKLWLDGRNACGADHACLARVQRERIQQLQPGYATAPEQPAPMKGGEGTQLVVNVPQLNVFELPGIHSRRVGELAMGDSVMAHQTRLDSDGQQWTWVCTNRFCGWVAAEFLELPRGGLVAPPTAAEAPMGMPHAGAPPAESSRSGTANSSPPPLDDLPDIEGLEKLR